MIFSPSALQMYLAGFVQQSWKYSRLPFCNCSLIVWFGLYGLTCDLLHLCSSSRTQQLPGSRADAEKGCRAGDCSSGNCCSRQTYQKKMKHWFPQPAVNNSQVLKNVLFLYISIFLTRDYVDADFWFLFVVLVLSPIRTDISIYI